MSNYTCPHCGENNIDSPDGYVTGCDCKEPIKNSVHDDLERTYEKYTPMTDINVDLDSIIDGIQREHSMGPYEFLDIKDCKRAMTAAIRADRERVRGVLTHIHGLLTRSLNGADVTNDFQEGYRQIESIINDRTDSQK